MLSKGDKSFHQILIYFLFLFEGKYYQDRFLKLHLSCPILSLLFFLSSPILHFLFVPVLFCVLTIRLFLSYNVLHILLLSYSFLYFISSPILFFLFFPVLLNNFCFFLLFCPNPIPILPISSCHVLSLHILFQPDSVLHCPKIKTKKRSLKNPTSDVKKILLGI